MARRDDKHHQHQIHYASIMPSTPVKSNRRDDSSAVRKPTELERAKALYVDFEDAFQDDTTNHDYFGYQPSAGDQLQQDSHQPANFYLQSVETISEVKNTNFSPYIRYQASHENSRPSTPSDVPSFQTRHQTRSNPSPLALPSFKYLNQRASPITGMSNLNDNFANLNLLHQTDVDRDSPVAFTPDAFHIRTKPKQPYDDSLIVSSQFKLILPQYFAVKYLGRTTCVQLWGAKAVRAPIDDMVLKARQLASMNEIPTLEACINTRGLTLTHRHSPTRTKHQPRVQSPDRHQHGLIPLEYISYVMHDIKYSKVAACVVLRQPKVSSTENKKAAPEAVTECYGFLFQSKEHAHRFALSLAEAFNAQKHPSRTSKHQQEEKREGRSPERRSKHRSSSHHPTHHHHHHHHHHQHPHHHERKRVDKYDDSDLRDSEV